MSGKRPPRMLLIAKRAREMRRRERRALGQSTTYAERNIDRSMSTGSWDFSASPYSGVTLDEIIDELERLQ